jgi:hypothetical protein
VLDTALAAAAAKAKLTGLVIAAAAIGGTAVAAGSTAFVPAGDATVAVATDSPSPEVSPTLGVAPTDSPAPVETPVTPTSPAPVVCPTGLPNHGAYVSSVAHDKTLKGRAHGAAVSAAAKSDCGKTAGGSADATESPDAAESPEPADSPEASDAADDQGDGTSTDEPSTAPAGHGHGKHHG